MRVVAVDHDRARRDASAACVPLLPPLPRRGRCAPVRAAACAVAHRPSL